jgi:hypothetical protein
VTAVDGAPQWIWFGRHLRDPGGAPWAGGSVSWMAAPRGFKLVARLTAALMAEANAVKKRAVPRRLLEAARSAARRTAEASAAKRRAASSQLEATRATVWRTAGASGAKRRAASSQLKATRVPLSLE